MLNRKIVAICLTETQREVIAKLLAEEKAKDESVKAHS
jgi:hypothetical protein